MMKGFLAPHADVHKDLSHQNLVDRIGIGIVRSSQIWLLPIVSFILLIQRTMETRAAKRLRLTHPVLLDDSILKQVVSFLPNRSFRIIGGINKKFKQIYLTVHNGSKLTSLQHTVESVEMAKLWISDGGAKTTISFNAALHGKVDVLNYLKKANFLTLEPDVCMQVALAGPGQVHVLEWLGANGWTMCDDDAEFISLLAAKHGNVEVLQWLKSQGLSLAPKLGLEAVMGGSVNVLEWLWDNDWDLSKTCYFAACHGQLEILKWARDRGLPWNEFVCQVAAQNGRLTALKWASENGCDFNIPQCLFVAKILDQNEIVQWIQGTWRPMTTEEVIAWRDQQE